MFEDMDFNGFNIGCGCVWMTRYVCNEQAALHVLCYVTLCMWLMIRYVLIYYLCAYVYMCVCMYMLCLYI